MNTRSLSLELGARPAEDRRHRLPYLLGDRLRNLTGHEFLRTLVQGLAELLAVDDVMICDCRGPTSREAKVLAHFSTDGFRDTRDIALVDTPGAEILKAGEYAVSTGVQSCFPDDRLLQDLHADSYFGVAVRGQAGESIGYLALLHSQPVVISNDLKAFLHAHGDRMAAELEIIRTNALIKEQAELFRIMADALPVCIAYVNANERYEFVNATYEKWHNLAKSEVEGQKIRDVLGEKPYNGVKNRIRAALNGESQSFDYLAEYARGESRYVHVEYVPYVSDFATTPVGFFALIADVTEHKSSEDRLNELMQRYRAVTMAAFDGFAISEDGVYLEVNKRYARSLGYEPEEIVGKSYRDLVSPASIPDIEKRLSSGHEGIYETIARRKDGSTFPVEICGVNVGVGGRNLRVHAARDISERVELEREVVDISHREQTRIGHDLHDSVGQQLTGLSLALETIRHGLIAEGSRYSDELGDLCQMIKRTIQSARSLARGLAPVFDRDHGLADALDMLAEETERFNDVRCRSEGYDRDAIKDVAVATQIYRIAQEAVANAVRHAGASLIDMQTFIDGADYHLVVADDGAGIEDVDLASDGLGMKTMAYRARMLSGYLQVKPGESAGTCVDLSFPLPAAGD